MRTRIDLLNLLEFSQIAYDTSFIKPKGFELALKNCKSCKTPGFKASGKLHTAQAGNGDVRIKGRAGSLGVVIDGSGDVYCADLLAERVAVRIRGSGDARVHATDELKVDIDGSGDVRYRGTPTISKSVRGAGAVRPLS